jgi:hypothetical protein
VILRSSPFKIPNSAEAASEEKALLWSSRSTLEKIPHREVLLLRETGLKYTQLDAIFKSSA